MRTIRLLFKSVLIIGVSITIACNDILDKDPIGILDAGSLIKTTEDAIQAMNTAYQPLLISNDNNNWYWVLGTVASDDAIAGGDGSRAGIVDIDFLRHTPRTEELNDLWKLYYKGIIQCNLVIERTSEIEDNNEDLKQRIIGEALFLRAYYHFLLSQIYGDVPLIIAIQPPDEVYVPRDPVATVRNQIIQDCLDAAPKLPVSYADPASNGRATRGAALALAAKTALYQKDWDAVITHVGQVKALGIYSLVEDYGDNWRDSTQLNSESVWEIQHSNLELGVGNNLNQWWTSKKIEDGYGFAEVTADFVDEFEPGDPRLGFTVAQKNEDYFGVVYKPSFSSTGFSPRKFLQHPDDVSQKSDGGINYGAIRYAEVLLWEAEALAESGRVAEAQIPLEEVRARARAQASDPSSALPMVTTTDRAEMIDAIRHERRVELGFEMHRFFDLVRWGIASQVLPDFQSNKNEVFPIPQTEIDLNPQLDQNPGY